MSVVWVEQVSCGHILKMPQLGLQVWHALLKCQRADVILVYWFPGIILCICPAHGRRYIVMSLIGWGHVHIMIQRFLCLWKHTKLELCSGWMPRLHGINPVLNCNLLGWYQNILIGLWKKARMKSSAHALDCVLPKLTSWIFLAHYGCLTFNSVVPGRCGSNFKCVISGCISQILSWALEKLLLGELHRMPLMESQYWSRWSEHGLMLSYNKPLPVPVLTQIMRSMYLCLPMVSLGHELSTSMKSWHVILKPGPGARLTKTYDVIIFSNFYTSWDAYFVAKKLNPYVINMHLTDFYFCMWFTISLNCDVISLVRRSPGSLWGRTSENGFTTFHCQANSLGPSDTIWQHWSGSALAQVMVCRLATPSHYLNQCWLTLHISKVKWHLPESNFTRNTSGSH